MAKRPEQDTLKRRPIVSAMMWAGVLHAKDDLRYEKVVRPTPKRNEVLVKVKYSGICGSDVPRVLGDAAHFYPVILGHEFSGIAAEVGEDVKDIAVGDHVAGAPLVPCMECEDCQRGDYALCKRYSFVGTRQSGSFAEYVCVPAVCTVRLDESISFEQAALIEPITIALHGLERLDYRGGKTVAILGGGTIGLLCAQWAKAFGAREVTVFDVVPERLELARKMGATNAIDSSDVGYREQVSRITEGRGYDYVYETAGANATMQMVFELVANKGQACLIGKASHSLTFSVDEWERLHRREFTLTGSWLGYSAPFPGHEWALAVEALRTGVVTFDEGMLFATYGLSELVQAFDQFRVPSGVKGKILLDCER